MGSRGETGSAMTARVGSLSNRCGGKPGTWLCWGRQASQARELNGAAAAKGRAWWVTNLRRVATSLKKSPQKDGAGKKKTDWEGGEGTLWEPKLIKKPKPRQNWPRKRVIKKLEKHLESGGRPGKKKKMLKSREQDDPEKKPKTTPVATEGLSPSNRDVTRDINSLWAKKLTEHVRREQPGGGKRGKHLPRKLKNSRLTRDAGGARCHPYPAAERKTPSRTASRAVVSRGKKKNIRTMTRGRPEGGPSEQ